MWVNDGTYRRSEFRFEKFLNNEPVYSDGFPLTVSILAPFAEYPSLTEEEFSRLTESQYQTRLSAFYQYLQLTYPFFTNAMIPDAQDQGINSNGTNTNLCSIDLTPEFQPYIRLKVDYFVLADGLEAEIKAQSVDRNFNPVNVAETIPFSYILKQAGISASSIWDSIEGTLMTSEILAGTSETVLVPRFRYRGTENDLLYMSVFVQLLSMSEEQPYKLLEPMKISLTLNPPIFLHSFVSNLESSAQSQLTQAQAQEIVNSGLGLITTGKSTYRFTFQSNIPQRPVLMYPASWGLLSQIIYEQGFNANLLETEVFQLINGEPYQVTLNVDGASNNYLIYSASNLIIYPKKADYLFKFDGT